MTATARKYYTLCVWIPGDDENADPGCWGDEFGSYSRKEAEGEKEFAWDHMPKGHVKIVSHADGAAAMMAARDALARPKGRHA